MAYVNVAEWSPDQVAEWLRGLDDVIQPYIHYFVENKVNGKQLLHLSPADFPKLSVTSIGHQAIILQGVELLRNIHFHLDQENVQYLALRLSSKSRSVYNEIRRLNQADISNGLSGEEEQNDRDAKDESKGGSSSLHPGSQGRERVSTKTLSGVVDVLSAVKSIVSWLQRSPFSGVEGYDNLKSSLIDLSIGLAAIAQREFAFSENPVSAIRDRCFTLAELADKIVQDFRDPLILQPASLDVVTVKKRADDNWGLSFASSYHGIHQISMIRALSPAHTCAKLMGDDQIVQVNYQTIVGWNTHKVTRAMQENPCEVILTVKKCPRHDANNLTKIYFKPIRLPSKKRIYSPWGNKVLSPTKYDLQSIPNLEFIKSFDGRSAARRVVSTEPHPKSITPPPNDTSSGGGTINSSTSDIGAQSSSESDEGSEFEDDAFLSDAELGGSSSLNVRMFQPKPRPPVQRRATIPGATARPNLSFDQMLHSYCQNRYYPPFSAEPPLIRPKEPSPGNVSPRPHTCLGTENKVVSDSLHKDLPFIDDTDEKDNREPDPLENPSERNTSPLINSIHDSKVDNHTPPKKMMAYPSFSVVEVQDDGICKEAVRILSPPSSPVDGHQDLKGTRKISEDRPKLDKSYSSPTYDESDEPPDFFINKNTLDVTHKSGKKQPSPPKKEDEVLREEKESSSLDVSEPPRKKVQTNPPSISTSSMDSDLFTSKLPLTQAKTSPSLGPLASLALSTIPISAVPASASAFDQLYGTTKYSTMFSPCEGINPTNTITVNVSSCDILSDNSSYVPMNAIEDLRDNMSISSPQKTNLNFSNNTHATNTTLQDKSDAEHGNENYSASSVNLREDQSKSPLAWRKGLVLSGAGSRRISCRELGQCDHHGWLYRRKESKAFLMSHRWEKRWFVLKKSDLYGYRDRDSTKADSYIYLPGFYVCPASDIKSKRLAFKIYHSSGATFYFACDTAEERSRWMSQMGLSAISKSGGYSTKAVADREIAHTEEAYYSETDDELEDKSPVSSRAHMSPANKDFGHLKSSPHLGSHNCRTPQSASSGGIRSQGIRFLQASKPSLGQPVPTSNFRSYVRVRDPNPPRSTSVNDLLITEVNSPEKNDKNNAKETPKGAKAIRRKGSLRERLRQIPASLTLDRKRGHQRLASEETESSCITPTTTALIINKPVYGSSKSETSLLDGLNPDESKKPAKSSASSSHLPNYMRHTRSSSQNFEIESLNRNHGTCSPSFNIAPAPSLHVSSRRGSLSGVSSSNASTGSLSPRRGSLDCLSHNSPPAAPMKGMSSTGRLAVQEEYLEGSPEKMWISSLRSDKSRPRSSMQVAHRMMEKKKDDKLKRTSDYHAMDLKRNLEPLQPAFELSLSETKNYSQRSQGPTSEQKEDLNKKNNKLTSPKPQVPPRTKFLSPSERILSPSSNTSSSPPYPTMAVSPEEDSEQMDTTSRISRCKAPPNLTITPASDDSDNPKTPLKPAMGISMIGKQRRTPVGVVSPREVFFPSPPHSPKPFSPPLSTTFSNSPLSPPTCTTTSSHSLSRAQSDGRIKGLKMEKILPHYPGTEYPPTFEPESYCVNLSAEEHTFQSRPDGNSPQTTLRSSPWQNEPSGAASFLGPDPRNLSPRSSPQLSTRHVHSASTLPIRYSNHSPQFSSHGIAKPSPTSKYPTIPKRSPRSSPQQSSTPSPRSILSGRNVSHSMASLSPVKEANPFDEAAARTRSAGYVNISHVSSTLDDLNSNSYHHNIYVTSPCSQGIQPNFDVASRAPPSYKTLAKAYSHVTSTHYDPKAKTDFQANAYLPMDTINLQYINILANEDDSKEPKKS